MFITKGYVCVINNLSFKKNPCFRLSCFAQDDKARSAKNLTVKDEASSKPTVKYEVSSKPTVKNEASSKPTAGPAGPFAATAFDCSTMSGLLNDPSIKKLAEQIAEDPSFNQMADKPEFLLSIMQQAMKIPNFKTMAKRLCIALLQDPSMSSMLQHFTNLPNPPNKEEIMEHINKDPSLKDIFDVMETGGPAAMMRYWNDEEVLKNLGLAMGINPNTGEAAASSDNPLGLNPPLSEVSTKLVFGFILKLHLVVHAHSRPVIQRNKNHSFPFYLIGCSRPKSGANLCVQETKPLSWRNALLPLLAELEEEEKVKVAKLVDVTEPEMLKVKVPRFIKEFILIQYVHCIMDDMRLYNHISLKTRRCYISDEAYNRGGEPALEAAITGKENELDALFAKKLNMQRRNLKREFEKVDKEEADDKICN
ncbi:uncharacterized protein LOC123908286 isoform X2 [Trifolium pratense]|uniref:uncharacterized protein LOC123908286 isoform X2 n=1 Tax=Trifolium pratense TaxID=57577 RepID=UPI001E690301|nr:uncharacterized protein LOC123908286 isoform X2 [Trifolium pratense]